MPLLRKLNSWMKRQHLIPVKPFPLDIPEILEVIFSYLSQHILQKYATLVCRQWYNVAIKALLLTRAITCTHIWQRAEDEVRQLIHDLPRVRVLKLTNFYYVYNNEWSRIYYKICTSLSALAMDDRLKLEYLSINLQNESERDLFSLINTTGPFLTRLELARLRSHEIPLKGVLARCPKLLDLKIECHCDSFYGAPLLDNQDIPDQLVLRSLTLQSVPVNTTVPVNSTVLMQVLRSSPNMEKLQLIRIVLNDPITQDEHISHISISVFEESFLRGVAQLCPKLQKVHLSNEYAFVFAIPSYEMMNQLLSLFPRVKGWGFAGEHLNSTRGLQTISNRTNTITSLEITLRRSLRNLLVDYLHEFLCESPQLLHLNAPDVEFTTILLDLEGAVDWAKWNIAISGKCINPYPRKIWACRNLQTLCLTFSGTESDNSTTAAATRLVFGYISKVCPRLQELVIAQVDMDLSRKGGLCLLTRLHSLRLLGISSETSRIKQYPSEVEWISRNMSQSLKIKLNLLVSAYNFMEPKTLFATSPFQCTTNAYHPFCLKDLEDAAAGSWRDGIWKDDHIIDGVDIKYLGRLKDVTMCFQDRLSSNMPCWPHLESIIFCRDYFGNRTKKIEKAVAYHRPDVAVN